MQYVWQNGVQMFFVRHEFWLQFLQIARRVGLFHDIGKSANQEVDGGHAQIGADMLRRAHEDPLVVNGVESHHGEAGLHYLCRSYKEFFAHVDRPMRFMAGALRAGRHADEVMGWMARVDARTPPAG